MGIGAKTKAYFINNDTKETFKVQFNPEKYDISKSINFGESSSPGMNIPITTYIGGTAWTTSPALYFHDRGGTGIITKAENFFKKFIPPSSNSISFTKPPTLTYAYGSRVMKCILLSYSLEVTLFDANLVPIEANIKLSLKEVE